MPPELPRVTTANLFADYVALLDLYAAMLGPQPTGVGGNEDERLLAGFAVKLFQHLTTMLLLSNEETVRVRGLGIDLTLMDHPSAMVVARAALETYVVFAYLFDPSVTEDERSLRRDSWELYDLLQRQEFIASEPFARAQLEEDAEQIAHLGERLKLNPSLKLLKSKEQKAVLSGDWRARQSWKEIGELVGFHPRYFFHLHAHFCSYAHSGKLSVIQTRQAQDQKARIAYMRVWLQTGLTIMACFLARYAELSAEARTRLLAGTAARAVVEKWRHYPETWERLIDESNPPG